ncbi:putative basic proline-rich protein-like [Iris pallida]|uniref:Basic proline-rich protein-like n=1 Tax=Iris pallida TaxID=29817 RepID=A0AAX6HT18_IRIPA|nr:putative basic proline-rich protein-like [Iris pallida]
MDEAPSTHSGMNDMPEAPSIPAVSSDGISPKPSNSQQRCDAITNSSLSLCLPQHPPPPWRSLTQLLELHQMRVSTNNLLVSVAKKSSLQILMGLPNSWGSLDTRQWRGYNKLLMQASLCPATILGLLLK